MGYPPPIWPGQDGVTPISHLARSGWGKHQHPPPHLARSGWDTLPPPPPARDGPPPPWPGMVTPLPPPYGIGQQMEYLIRRNRYPFCGVPQEDFLVKTSFHNKLADICRRLCFRSLEGHGKQRVVWSSQEYLIKTIPIPNSYQWKTIKT